MKSLRVPFLMLAGAALSGLPAFAAPTTMIHMTLPQADALVYFDDTLTQQTGTDRTFEGQTQYLQEGRMYHYNIKVQVPHGKRMIEKVLGVDFQLGDYIEVTFNWARETQELGKGQEQGQTQAPSSTQAPAQGQAPVSSQAPAQGQAPSSQAPAQGTEQAPAQGQAPASAQAPAQGTEQAPAQAMGQQPAQQEKGQGQAQQGQVQAQEKGKGRGLTLVGQYQIQKAPVSSCGSEEYSGCGYSSCGSYSGSNGYYSGYGGYRRGRGHGRYYND